MTIDARHRAARALLRPGSRWSLSAALSLGLAALPGLSRAAAVDPGPSDGGAPATAADSSEELPADDPPTRASLEVDASTLGAQSPVLLRRIEELGDIELRRAEILPSRQPRDPLLKISVFALDGGGYRIRSHLEIDSELVPNSDREVLCTLCTEGETVERARIEVDRLIPFVRDHARAEADAEARAREADTTRETATTAATDDRPRLAPLSKAGIALLATGSAGLGLGLGLALREPTVKPEMPLETLDTRTPGYVALGVGGALIIGGVALILTGQRRARASTVSFAPTLRGAVLTGRF